MLSDYAEGPPWIRFTGWIGFPLDDCHGRRKATSFFAGVALFLAALPTLFQRLLLGGLPQFFGLRSFRGFPFARQTLFQGRHQIDDGREAGRFF